MRKETGEVEQSDGRSKCISDWNATGERGRYRKVRKETFANAKGEERAREEKEGREQGEERAKE